MAYERTRVSIGSSHATLENGSGPTRVASILELVKDDEGKPCRVLLDRNVASTWEQCEGWMVSGCFCTELVRADIAEKEKPKNE